MIFISLLLKTNYVAVLIILPLSYCIVFAIRIYIRGKNLKNLNYFNINEKGYVTDTKKRGDQLGDVVSIIIYIFIALLENGNKVREFENSTLGITLFCSAFYFTFASASISKNSKLLKVATILLSTIQGLLFLLIGASTILMCATSLMQGRGIQPLESFLSMFNGEFVVTLCYCAEVFLKETVFIMIASTILFLVFIFSTPPYQLEELAMAFKIVNLIIIILGITIYFFANMSWINIQEFIKEINSTTGLYKLQYGILTQDFRNYLQVFSKSSIINMGYILFLPYTLGTIISNLAIESLKKKYFKKALYAFDCMLEVEENKNLAIQENVCPFRRQYIFFGGDKYLLKIFDASHKRL